MATRTQKRQGTSSLPLEILNGKWSLLTTRFPSLHLVNLDGVTWIDTLQLVLIVDSRAEQILLPLTIDGYSFGGSEGSRSSSCSNGLRQGHSFGVRDRSRPSERFQRLSLASRVLGPHFQSLE